MADDLVKRTWWQEIPFQIKPPEENDEVRHISGLLDAHSKVCCMIGLG